MNKKQARIRRARQTKLKIAELAVNRLAVHRTNLHIYANIIDANAKILASASTLETEFKTILSGKSGRGGNIEAATMIGQKVAERAMQAGVTEVAFDRAGFRYHGRVQALAEAARKAGLKF